MEKTHRIFIASGAVIATVSATYATIGGGAPYSDLLCQLLLFFCAVTITIQIIPGVILGWLLFGVLREITIKHGDRGKRGKSS